jgi:hypothetical protein
MQLLEGAERLSGMRMARRELVCPARLITQHVLELPLRLLTGEEGGKRALLTVNEAPKVWHVLGRTWNVPATGFSSS